MLASPTKYQYSSSQWSEVFYVYKVSEALQENTDALWIRWAESVPLVAITGRKRMSNQQLQHKTGKIKSMYHGAMQVHIQ